METILKITMALGFLLLFLHSFDSKGQVVSCRIKFKITFQLQDIINTGIGIFASFLCIRIIDSTVQTQGCIPARFITTPLH